MRGGYLVVILLPACSRSWVGCPYPLPGTSSYSVYHCQFEMVDWELVAQLDQLLGFGIGIDDTRVCAGR